MNKYRGIQVNVPEMGPVEGNVFGMRDGFTSALTPREMPLSAFADTNQIVFDKGGFRRDNALSPSLGTPASGTVFGLGFGFSSRHRFVVDTSTEIGIVQVWDRISQVWFTLAGTFVTTTNLYFDYIPSYFVASVGSATLDMIVFAAGSNIYKVAGGGAIVSLLGGSPPLAFFVFAFGGRIIAFGTNTAASLQWSALNDPETWTGPGTGSLTVRDPFGSDVNDTFVGAGSLTSQTFAAFRRRNIDRGFLTGNATSAIGITKGVDGVGCLSPATISEVAGLGLIFLGSDMMVYILTSNFELIPVGEPIRKELPEPFTSELRLADFGPGYTGAYDPFRMEYYFSRRRDGNVLYKFDVGLFRSTQKLVWSSRPVSNSISALSGFNVGESSKSGGVGLPAEYAWLGYIDGDTQVISSDIFGGTGQVVSPSFNRDGKILTINELTFYYREPSATPSSGVTVEVSPDGGLTWPFNSGTILLSQTAANGENMFTVSPRITGSDLRFRLSLLDSFCTITGFRPKVVERGSIEYVS